MYVSPYLTPLHLPSSEATRCKFVFNTKGLTAKDDNYRGKLRYRFNKWQPVSASLPLMHSSGLVFSANQECGLTGIASVFTIPWDANGSVNFLFGPTIMKKFDILAGDVYEMGVGFLKYTAPYWGLAQACEFRCERRFQAGDTKRHYYGLNNVKIPTMSASWDPNRYAGFTLWFTSTTLTITYAEYTEGGITLYSDSRTYAYTNPEQTPYRVVFYMQTSPKAEVESTLIRTKIDVDKVKLAPIETIYFRDQPADYIPPLAPLRDPGVHLYNPPHVALIEDATLSVGSPTVTPEWWGILKFLVSAAPETCVFTDPDGTEFRVCFQDLTAKTANLTGYKGIGYDLTMAVMVPH